MKLLFILSEYPCGGAEKQAMNLAKNLSSMSHTADILAFENKETITYEGIRIVGLGEQIAFSNSIWLSKQIKRFSAYKELASFIKTCDYDCYVVFNALFLPLSAFLDSRRMIYFFRGSDPWTFRFPFRQFLSRYGAIASNNFSAYLLATNSGLQARFITNIVRSFPSKTEQVSKNKRYLIISNISSRKNLEVSVEAFHMLSDEGYTLAIAGKSHGEYGEEFIKKVNPIKNIECLGYLDQSRLQEELTQCEGVIHPSRLEGVPNALLDAMSCGKPVLASRIPEHVYLLEGIDRFLFDPDSSSELVEKVKSTHLLLETSPEVLYNYLQYFEKKTELTFSQQNAKSFLELAEKVVNRE